MYPAGTLESLAAAPIGSGAEAAWWPRLVPHGIELGRPAGAPLFVSAREFEVDDQRTAVPQKSEFERPPLALPKRWAIVPRQPDTIVTRQQGNLLILRGNPWRPKFDDGEL